MWCEFWPWLFSADWLLSVSALHSTSPKNQLRVRRGTCQGRLSSSRRTRYVLMNKEWTSQLFLSYTHTQCLPMCVNSLAHTHLCGSHTCQSGFSLTERRKSEWETQQFAGVELLASVLLVGLSVHVQRQRLCALLSGGRWAWVLRTEGFWHCVRLRVCVFLCSCASMCVTLVWSVCWAELWAFWGFQSSSTLLCDWEGEAQSQTALCFYPWVEQRAAEAAELWKSRWLNCLLHQKQNNSNTDFTEAATFTFLKFNQSAIDYIKDFYTAENNPSILSKATKILALFR